MFLVVVAGDMNRAFADRRIVVFYRGDKTTFAQSTQGVEKVQCVEAGERRIWSTEVRLNQRQGGGVSTFEDQSTGCVAVPAVGMVEGFDQFRQGGLAQVDRASADPVLVVGHQAIDTAAVIAVIQVEVFLDFVGDGPRVLDHFAIHVADVEAAVGCVGEIDHANPGVAARGKLEALFIGRTFP